MNDIMQRLELGPAPQFAEDLDTADVIPDRLSKEEPNIPADVSDVDDQIGQHRVRPRSTKVRSRTSKPSANSSTSTFISPSGGYFL